MVDWFPTLFSRNSKKKPVNNERLPRIGGTKRKNRKKHRGTRGIHFPLGPIFPVIFRFSNFSLHTELHRSMRYIYIYI